MLPDGTRVTLNTATRVRATLTQAKRVVQVSLGEALFEVAKDATRPFVVQVADANVTATGTTFLVRATPQRGDEAFDVTLIEGQVIVNQAGRAAHGRSVEQFVMEPGERLRARSSGGGASDALGARLDRPKLENLTAWKRGEVVLDDVSLVDAVLEMNRYSKLPVVILDMDTIGSLRISGIMHAGDSEAFARAVASLHGLSVRMTDRRIELDTK
ncbi:FecR family protein [Roseateles saccharophilus]|uniref:FecR family protein n=2 Tax=Roseateles saccharophilus TaxID=304 RepID=A0A4R3U4P0_ROSSA|nr:FecR family protein [Roseateles saccharophilus]